MRKCVQILDTLLRRWTKKFDQNTKAQVHQLGGRVNTFERVALIPQCYVCILYFRNAECLHVSAFDYTYSYSYSYIVI